MRRLSACASTWLNTQRPMIDAAFTEPQRQNGFAILVYWVDFMKQFFLRGVYGLIPLIIDPGIWWLLLILLILGLIATGFAAMLTYYHYEFYLTTEELVIEQGLFNKQRSNIPFERIQTVHLHQNLIQKTLGVKGVQVQTAGSQQQENEIKGLSDQYAQQLKTALKAYTYGKATVSDDATENDEEKESQALVNLSLRDLSLIALTDNHFRNGGVIIAFVFATASQFYPQASYSSLIDTLSFSSLVGQSLWLKGLYGMLLFVAMVLLVAFVKHFHYYYAFTSSLTNEGFQTKGGLLRRNEYTIPYPKIQFLEWETNFIRWPLNMQTINVYPAQSTGGEVLSNVTIPGCFTEASHSVMEAVYSDFTQDEARQTLQPIGFYKVILLARRLLLIGLLAGAVGYFYSLVWAAGIFAVLAGFQGIAVPRYVDSISLEMHNSGIIYRRGWLFPAVTVLRSHKLQGVRIKQNIIQQRRGTCHLLIGTAAGAFRIPFLPKDAVMPVYDWLLYKTETYQGSWM